MRTPCGGPGRHQVLRDALASTAVVAQPVHSTACSDSCDGIECIASSEAPMCVTPASPCISTPSRSLSSFSLTMSPTTARVGARKA